MLLFRFKNACGFSCFCVLVAFAAAILLLKSSRHNVLYAWRLVAEGTELGFKVLPVASQAKLLVESGSNAGPKPDDITNHTQSTIIRPQWVQNERCSYYSWDPPTLCPQGNDQWSVEDLRQAVPEFANLYKNRPLKRNPGGMGVNHAFALWFTIRSLKPKHIIESGAKFGQTTWILRNAAGPDAWIYSLDPANKKSKRFDPKGMDTLKFRDDNAKTKYFRNANFIDLAKINWSRLIPSDERSQTFVLLDDHMSSTRRVRELLSFGFVHLFYDDNAKKNNDCYSFNWVCSPLPAGMSKVPYLDHFHQTKTTITVPEHMANLDFFSKHIDVYFEFPPIFDGCLGLPSGCRDQRCSLIEHGHLQKLQLPSVPEDVGNYITNHPPYVRLRV